MERRCDEGVTADRTGTLGLYWALNMLGYRTYHMVEVLDNPERDLPILIEAYNEKYNGGRPYGREEFDKWYGQYNVSAMSTWYKQSKQLTSDAERRFATFPARSSLRNSTPPIRTRNSSLPTATSTPGSGRCTRLPSNAANRRRFGSST